MTFQDTAESYPFPAAMSTSGKAEELIGRWMATNASKRKDLILSSSVSGYSDQMNWLRGSNEGTRLTRQQIIQAVDASLKRLNTDYLDILQLHWPERYVPMNGAPEYLPKLERSDVTSIEDQLQVMDELIKAGKIRAFGLSNETPYGVAAFSTAARLLNLPRPVLTQCTHNLLVRNDLESGMIEACAPPNADVAILACSPLAGGALTGKYLDAKTVPPNARMRQFVGFMNRFIAPPALEATRLYKEVAAEVSVPLTPLALAWVYSRPYVTSTVVGATSAQQLMDNVLPLNLQPLSEEVNSLLDKVYRQYLDPCRGVFDVTDPHMEYTDPSTLPWGGKDMDVDPDLDILLTQRFQRF